MDSKTVEGFGDEWSRFTQDGLTEADLRECFDSYFRIFPWADLPSDAVGFDAGCGSGRWAAVVAPRVGTLHCVDASDRALEVARKNLAHRSNCRFHECSVAELPFEDGSMDFGYSLGVLHHVPDTRGAIRACVSKLKRGAPFLVYLYYAFDNRPEWYRRLWQLSEFGRATVSSLPMPLRYGTSQVIAASVYLPLARFAKWMENVGVDVQSFPLTAYRDRSFYVMRTDALDRFGTRLEQRFTAAEITSMLEDAGLENIRFSDAVPYWCAVGTKA
ncbi:MAG: class I SAM-dependent methyltransferase [Polyangiaceae bacterium]